LVIFAWFALSNNNKRKFQFSFYSSGPDPTLERSKLFAFFILTVELLQQYYAENSVPFREALEHSERTRGHLTTPRVLAAPSVIRDRLPLCYSTVLKIFTHVPQLVDTSSFYRRLEILDQVYTWKKREQLDDVFDKRFNKELQTELYRALQSGF
jgi:hypothetical protein